MTFKPNRTLLTLLILASMTPACAACVSAPRTVTLSSAHDCGTRVPPQLRKPVAPADLPASSTQGEWVAFGDAQTGKLDQANDRNQTVLWIVDNCEAEKNKAVKEATSRSVWDKLAFWK